MSPLIFVQIKVSLVMSRNKLSDIHKVLFCWLTAELFISGRRAAHILVSSGLWCRERIPLSPEPLFFNEGNERIYCALNYFLFRLALSLECILSSSSYFLSTFCHLSAQASEVKFLHRHLHRASESLNKLFSFRTICCDMIGVARLSEILEEIG